MNSNFSIHPIVVQTKYSLKSFNFYLIEESGTLTLLDAGINSEECWNAFQETLNKLNASISDITHVILTHNHEDHVGLLNRITSIKELPVYAHPESIYRLKRDKAYFTLRIAFFDQLYKEMGCGESGEKQIEKLKNAMAKHEDRKIKADIIPIQENDVTAGLRTIETPGHSPDHLIFLNQERKIMFGGDHVIKHISSNAIVEPDRHGNRMLTLVQYVDSLKKCLDLDMEKVYPGHGEIIEEPKDLIKRRIDRIYEKGNKFLLEIEKGYSVPSELAKNMYKSTYDKQFSLVMSEIIGQLDLLEHQNRVRKEMKDGVWHYDKVK